MKETIEKIQDWYKINCNDDWEHRYGYKIETLDNPGWAIKIDLTDTALNNLEFERKFQNPNNRDDWFNIQTENRILFIHCGPENMKKVFEIFFDEIILEHSDSNFEYKVHLPISGFGIEIWTPAKSKLINERTVQITEIEKIEYKNIKVRDTEYINFIPTDLEKLKLNYSVGDILEVELERIFGRTVLTAKSKKENG